ncbi:MAG: lysylphosphatidylglycerol synthase transmembrane domain-containing protein [Candidatus Omnitrophica bacterium]|nr:lysylphosphatidylglycerol synthase transmembrane domain-containing protein [Candidatus Omnitrophota bacterium]MDD5430049.1 lysylphosphatidylglycerol synthase transmembrane domain-containing protein [Candidatus Omnitrophota bacterium]
MKKKFFFIFRLIITASILIALFKFVPYKKIVEVYKNSSKLYLVLGGVLFFLSYLVALFRWRFLLVSLKIKASLREVCYSFFCGLFFNLFFPSFVAGDVFRAFSISYRHGHPGKIASSILMDRFSGSTALMLVAVFSFFAGRNLFQDKTVVFSLVVLFSAITFISLIIFSKTFFLFLMKIFKKQSGLRKKILSFHDHLYFFKKNPAIFFKSLLFSFPIQVLTPLGFFVASKGFHLDIGVLYFLTLVPIVGAIALIPITIAGAGTREASAVYFFSLVGIDKSIGLGISLLNLIFMIIMGILGGILYVSVYHRWFQSRPSGKKPEKFS